MTMIRIHPGLNMTSGAIEVFVGTFVKESSCWIAKYGNCVEPNSGYRSAPDRDTGVLMGIQGSRFGRSLP